MGARMLPILPAVEHRPTAELLELVGNSSDVYEKTTSKLIVANILPINEQAIW